MENSYNARCPAVKRLFREAKELQETTEEYYAQPLDDNLFEWHFTVRGPVDTEFDGGVYHGRIILPADYPMKPPNIIFLTANGRFETNKKICLSISGHHPETWQPSWSIRTALLAIIGFMPTPANGTIGSLDYTAPERQILAKKSQNYECGECGCTAKLLKERTGSNTELQEEAKKIMSECSITNPGGKKPSESSDAASGETSPDKASGTAEDADSRESSPVNGDNAITHGATGVQSLKTEATSQENLPGTTSATPQPEQVNACVAAPSESRGADDRGIEGDLLTTDDEDVKVFEEEEKRMAREIDRNTDQAVFNCVDGGDTSASEWSDGHEEQADSHLPDCFGHERVDTEETSQSEWSDDEDGVASEPLLDQESAGYTTDDQALEQISMINDAGLTDAEGAMSDVASMYNDPQHYDGDMDDTSMSSRASSRIFDSDAFISFEQINAYYESEYENYRPNNLAVDGFETEPLSDVDFDSIGALNLQNIRTMSESITRNFGQPRNETDVESDV